jgi:large subunit ribosomal protein L13
VNCEKAILTGRKDSILKKYRERRDRGNPLKGPFISFMPDRFVRRIIRGMLPYKQERGRLAYKRVMCYIGVPDKFKDQKIETIKEADVTKSKNTKFIDVDTLTKLIRK